MAKERVASATSSAPPPAPRDADAPAPEGRGRRREAAEEKRRQEAEERWREEAEERRLEERRKERVALSREGESNPISILNEVAQRLKTFLSYREDKGMPHDPNCVGWTVTVTWGGQVGACLGYIMCVIPSYHHGHMGGSGGCLGGGPN